MVDRTHPSKTRVVAYSRDTSGFDETAMECLLTKALRDGVITVYDTGRGHVVWFTGPPGAELRALRDAVDTIIVKGVSNAAQK